MATRQKEFVQLRDLSPPPAAYRSDYPPYEGYTSERVSISNMAEPGRSSPDVIEPSISLSDKVADENKTFRRRKAWQTPEYHPDAITKAGKFYRKVLNFSFVTRWILCN